MGLSTPDLPADLSDVVKILISILSPFRTLDLLSISLTSRRIYSLTLRILQHRLLETAQLKDHKLILEVFHPSTKLSTPYLFCDNIGTYGLHDAARASSTSSPLDPQDDTAVGKLGQLATLYSHFRPLKPSPDEHKPVRVHPAGGTFDVPNGLVDQHEEFVCQNIHLESHELFSQLQTITSLVKIGPRRGLFLSSVNISDDILRIWRPWLAEQASEGTKDAGDVRVKGTESLLWADAHQRVGLRLRVVEREEATPVLVPEGEDAAVSYTLQYEGKSPSLHLLTRRSSTSA